MQVRAQRGDSGPAPGPVTHPVPSRRRASYLRFFVLLPCSTSFTASYRVSRETLLLRGGKKDNAGSGLTPPGPPAGRGDGGRRRGHKAPEPARAHPRSPSAPR